MEKGVNKTMRRKSGGSYVDNYISPFDLYVYIGLFTLLSLLIFCTGIWFSWNKAIEQDIASYASFLQDQCPDAIIMTEDMYLSKDPKETPVAMYDDCTYILPHAKIHKVDVTDWSGSAVILVSYEGKLPYTMNFFFDKEDGYEVYSLEPGTYISIQGEIFMNDMGGAFRHSKILHIYES